MKIILALIAYHLFFFYKYYINPFLLCTSELVEIHFSHWTWLGKKGNLWRDDIYYLYPACMPHLSTFYPPYLLTSKLFGSLSKDSQFRLFIYVELIHYLICSILSYLMFNQWYSSLIALFGSITLTYMAYSMKMIKPYAVYTMAWIPGLFIGGWLGVVSMSMALLAGGYQILIYIMPISIAMNPMSLLGVIPGQLQLVPFLWYFPKTLKFSLKFDQELGRVSLKQFINLIIPASDLYINRLTYIEMAMFIGVIPLLFIPFSTSRIFLLLIISFLGMIGIIPVPFRAPARLIYPFCFSIIWMACSGMNYLMLSNNQIIAITLMQGFSLLMNIDVNVMFPLTQHSRKPSEFENLYDPLSFKFPFRTGYYMNEKTKGYTGSLALKKIANQYGIFDPNGKPSYY